MKLLIVEGDERIRQLIISIVADLATEFFECNDGATALKSFARNKPDVVLIDLMMPEIGGITAIQQIKAINPKAKIIVVTSYKGAVMSDEAARAGAFAYVLKENLLDLRILLASN